jgi:hypothetical protein
MEPKGSLPHPQVPATCPNPKPAQSSPYLHLCLGLLSGLFSSGFPIKTVHVSPLPHTPYMPRPSHSSVWTFCNTMHFYGEEFLPHPTPTLKDRHLSAAVRDC